MSLLPPVPPRGTPFVDLPSSFPDAELIQQLPASTGLRLGVLPLWRNPDGGCYVAMPNPLDIYALDELQAALHGSIHPVKVAPEALQEACQRWYQASGELAGLARALQQELSARRGGLLSQHAAAVASQDDAPVLRLLETVLAEALRDGASDVHFEPQASSFRIRQRIDGQLREQVLHQPGVYPALVIRLKLMAEIDITEKRLPQDGRFSIALGSRSLKLRIATLPTAHGEAIAMRLLTEGGRVRPLEDLGFSEPQLAQMERLLAYPHGAVLVAGPTGSGKTTTLNALMHRLDTPERKLVTLEDPIECQLPRATQVQVNPRIGLGYAQVLRAALRHDPDVLMVGEIRDREAADIALRAALTGHLLLSSIHCNSAAACLPRLLDMGVEPYVIAHAVRWVVAQRLVRLRCPHCPPSVEAAPPAGMAWSSPAPCSHCQGSGHLGRRALFEIVEVTPTVQSALKHGDTPLLAECAAQQGPSLYAQALALAEQGLIHPQEARRLSHSPTEVTA